MSKEPDFEDDDVIRLEAIVAAADFSYAAIDDGPNFVSKNGNNWYKDPPVSNP